MGIIKEELERIAEHKKDIQRFADSLTTVPYDYVDSLDLYWTVEPSCGYLYADTNLNSSNLAEKIENDELEVSDEANIVDEDEDYAIFFVYPWREFRVLDKSKRF